MQSHDWLLNWIVTPEAAIVTTTTYPRPTGLDWKTVQPEQLQQNPVLRQLKEQFNALQ